MSLYDDAVLQFKRKMLAETLESFDAHQQKAAAYLGIHRNTMSRLIAQCGVDWEGIKEKARRKKRGTSHARHVLRNMDTEARDHRPAGAGLSIRANLDTAAGRRHSAGTRPPL